MQVDIISDLHLDFYVKELTPGKKLNSQIEKFLLDILPINGKISDVLIIAGDTGHYNSQIKELLKQMKSLYDKVFYVHGNHDMYLLSKSMINKYKSSMNRINEMKEMCKELQVDYLDGDVVEYKGKKFGGCSGWYNLPTDDAIMKWKYTMNDSKKIYQGNEVAFSGMYVTSQLVSRWDTQKYYNLQVEHLKKIAKEQCDVLITHVGQVFPPTEVLPGIYKYDPNNMFFYVDNFDLVESTGCKTHIYGHTHDEHDWEIKGIQVKCNPKGYPYEANWTKVKTITV